MTNESSQAVFGRFSRILGACTFADSYGRPGLGREDVESLSNTAVADTRLLLAPDSAGCQDAVVRGIDGLRDLSGSGGGAWHSPPPRRPAGIRRGQATGGPQRAAENVS